MPESGSPKRKKWSKSKLSAKFECEGCGLPSHCSAECHSKDASHKAMCGELQMAIEDAEILFTRPLPRGFNEIDVRIMEGVKEMKMEPPKTWSDYILGRSLLRGSEELEDRALTRFLTSSLSFPMTLARWAPLVAANPANPANPEKSSAEPLVILVAGVRGEATLPPHIWREIAILLPGRQIHLVLSGPDIPESFHAQEMEIGPLRISWLRLRAEQIISPEESGGPGNVTKIDPSLLVIFHGGVGNPDVSEKWRPVLAQAAKMALPMLFTCFDGRDCDDDVAAVEKIVGSRNDPKVWIVEPTENPFRSYTGLLHPVDTNRVIYQNHSVFAVRPKAV